MRCVRLDQVCTLVTDGTHDSPRSVEIGVPLIKGTEIASGRIDFSGCQQISRADHQKVIARSKPEFGDILFANIGASIGDAAYVDTHREFSIKNVALFKPDPSKIDSRYLYYVVRSPNFRGMLLQKRSGSAQPFVGLATLRAHEFTIHSDLQAQRLIADILSAYDDLIENNTKRIKILEEMARSLYREWFVNFRFPGHEKMKMVNSPLGKVPEGWELRAVADTFDIVGGGTPSKENPSFWDGGTLNWYTPSDLTAAGCMFAQASGLMITSEGLARSSAKMFPAYSVMMTSRATIGVLAINTTDACTNQGFITCRPSARFPLYTLYLWLASNVETFIGLGTGATFKEITKGTFKKIELLVAEQMIVERFESTVRPIGNQILNLERRNRVLKATRDLLLPRLISGEVVVEPSA